MKLITKAQSIFSLLVLPLISLSSLFGQTIDLGTLSATNIQASSLTSQSYPGAEAFNGTIYDGADGWLAETDIENSLSWDFNPYANTQVDTSDYNQIQFSLTIYSGFATLDDLNKFSLSVAGEGEDFSSYVTNFDSLSSVQNHFFESTKTLTISSDASGLITVEDPRQEIQNISIHSIVFTVPHTVRRIQIETPIEADGFPSTFLINEIETSAVAVPEPSTFALLLGASVIGFGIFLRKP